MDYPVQPLYRLLQFWHYMSIMLKLISVAQLRLMKVRTTNEFMFNSALANHAEFEKTLLDVHTTGFDWGKFIGLENRQQYDWDTDIKSAAEIDLWWEMSSIPGMVASWTYHSRRVYTIPEDLQLLLASTSLENVDWTRVRMPFGSFLLNLAVPIEDPDGGSYDSILVTSDFPRWQPKAEDENDPITWVTASVIPVHLKSATADLPILKRQKYAKMAEKGDPALVAQELEASMMKNWVYPRPKLIFPLDFHHVPESIYLIETAKGPGHNSVTGAYMSGTARRFNRTVGRILFGFLLYLQTTPKDLTHADVLVNHGTEKIPGQARVVAEATKVCHIQSIFTLNPDERKVFREVMLGKCGHEVSTHYREGHWRRPPGKGEDPTAQKTVWVRPTIVRRDKLEVGTLPAGLEKIVT